jgi:hypothetical protein
MICAAIKKRFSSSRFAPAISASKILPTMCSRI